MPDEPDTQESADSMREPDPIVTSVDESREAPAALLEFPIAAIGASAGGLAAYTELLDATPADTGFAYVLLPHLAPTQPSHMAEILRRHTSMPVEEITEDARPKPNRIYVIAPNTRLSMERGVLRVTQRPPEERVQRPIDFFFRSLAADQKNHAIGILLSGADTDGSLGLKAIKGEGGIAIVQDPASARFEHMPRSGIAADHVDFVLTPVDIGRELGRIAQILRSVALPETSEEAKAPDEANYYDKIFTLLRGVSGIDFRNYKFSTIRRRIARRMLLTKVTTLGGYVRHLQNSPSELGELQEDILIGVTGFFRDPEVFESLQETIFPALVKDRPNDVPMRIWAAGCSSGEEVYSLAMCLLEKLNTSNTELPIQFFGTDASSLSIEKARAGIYPESIAAEIPQERLRRFFTKVDSGYQVAKRVRDLCIFARQNLCVDPPFSRLDMISCRNVLIYLDASMQKRIIPTFHYALKPHGYLVLGKSESIRNYSEYFHLEDRKHKIYARSASARPPLEFTPSFLSNDLASPRPPAGSPRENWNDVELQRAADRIALTRYGPPGLVVDEHMEVLQVRGHTSSFLEMQPGAVSANLFRLIREELAAQAREAFGRAMGLNVPVVSEPVELRDGQQTTKVVLEIIPIQGAPTHLRCFLVLFTTSDEAKVGSIDLPVLPPAVDEGDKERELHQLRQEIASTKLYLQSLLEDRDAKNQELVSANEEIHSSNEELQSINEELETAKEELQSANEELQTVNDELQNRNAELSRTSNDLLNLLNSVDLPLLMLSNELLIRHFTPPTQRLMNVRPTDIGRPFGDIRLNLHFEDLQPLLQEVLDTLAPKELEVQDNDGRWRLMRIRPYRTADNKIEGVVIVLVDIDQLRRTQAAMQEARDFADAVVERVHVPLVVLDSELRVKVANGAFRALAGQPSAGLEQRSFPELLSLLWGLDALREKLEAVRDGASDNNVEEEVETRDGRCLRFSTTSVGADGRAVLIVAIEDISARRQAEALRDQERARLASEVETTVRALERTQAELRSLAAGLFTASEDERRRLSRELHDDLCQTVGALAFKIDQALPNIVPEATGSLQEVRASLVTLSEEIRSLSHRLHPAVLDDLGLSVALKTLVEEFAQREGMIATFSRRNVPANIPLDVGTSLYRIAQEALNNIAKHAGRTHVKVNLSRNGDEICLTVRDFGEGFDSEGMRGRGLGLISMEERARLVGGVTEIASELGEGTTVTARVPLPPGGPAETSQ